jgi:antitoxin MazE
MVVLVRSGFEGLSVDGAYVWIYISVLYIQEIAMQVAKWGNSLAVRLPAAVVEALELKEGDDVTLHVLGARTMAVEKTPSADELFERVRRLRHKLPSDVKFDRLEANERR